MLSERAEKRSLTEEREKEKRSLFLALPCLCRWMERESLHISTQAVYVCEKASAKESEKNVIEECS